MLSECIYQYTSWSKVVKSRLCQTSKVHEHLLWLDCSYWMAYILSSEIQLSRELSLHVSKHSITIYHFPPTLVGITYDGGFTYKFITVNVTICMYYRAEPTMVTTLYLLTCIRSNSLCQGSEVATCHQSSARPPPPCTGGYRERWDRIAKKSWGRVATARTNHIPPSAWSGKAHSDPLDNLYASSAVKKMWECYSTLIIDMMLVAMVMDFSSNAETHVINP